jgi:hypothetical protein
MPFNMQLDPKYCQKRDLLFLTCTAQPTPLSHQLQLYGTQGLIRSGPKPIFSKTGTVQGAVISSLTYSLTTHPINKEMNNIAQQNLTI